VDVSIALTAFWVDRTPVTTIAMAPSKAMPVRSSARPGSDPIATPAYVTQKMITAVVSIVYRLNVKDNN
jgi:hypothetical protein